MKKTIKQKALKKIKNIVHPSRVIYGEAKAE